MNQLDRMYDTVILSNDKEITDIINNFTSALDEYCKDQNIEKELFKTNINISNGLRDSHEAFKTLHLDVVKHHRKQLSSPLPLVEKAEYKPYETNYHEDTHYDIMRKTQADTQNFEETNATRTPYVDSQGIKRRSGTFNNNLGKRTEEENLISFKEITSNTNFKTKFERIKFGRKTDANITR